MQDSSGPTEIYPATVDRWGRVQLPVELRRPMNIDHESNLSWVRDESGLHLKTFRESVAEFQAYFMSLSPPERVWSTELIAERKREAAAEAAKTGRNE